MPSLELRIGVQHLLAALLLFIKPRAGIVLTAAIILVDVIHNTFYVALKQQWLEPFYLSQVAFLIVVFLLSRIAWNGKSY